MKRLLRLLVISTVLIAGIWLGASTLFNTQHGLTWTMRLISAVVPGELSVQQIEGRLLGPITLTGVTYRNETMQIDIPRLTLRWQLGRLPLDKLHINELALSDITIQRFGSSDAGSSSLPAIELPLAVEIEQVSAGTLRMAEANAEPTVIFNHLTLRDLEFKGESLQLQQLSLQAPRYEVQLAGNVTTRDYFPLDVTLTWTAHDANDNTFAGKGTVRGDLRRLKLDQQLVTPAQAAVRATIDDPLRNLRWQAELSATELDLQKFNPAWPAVTLSGALQGKGDLQRVSADGEVRSRYAGIKTVHQLAVRYDQDQLTLERFDTRLANDTAALALRGTLTLGEALRVDLTGNWQDLHWPLQGDALLSSKKGQLTLKGTPENYRVAVAGDMTGNNLPVGNWNIEADGSLESLAITRAAGHLLGGNVTAQGSVVFQPLSWDVALSGRDLDPATLHSAWPGHLAFDVHSNGALRDGALQAQVELTHLEGEIAAVPVEADAILALQGDRLELTRAHIASNGNRFSAFGTLADEWNVHWQIIAPDLDKLVAGGGGLQGSGDVFGPRDHPQLTASLAGQQLNATQTHIGEIELVMAVDILGRIPSIIEIQARNIKTAGQQIDSLELRGDGTAERHTAQLSALSPQGSLALDLDGALADQHWQGTIAGLDIDTPALGHWELQAPAPLTATQNSAQLSDLCLHQQTANLCTAAVWSQQDGWQAQAAAHAVPLSLLKEWMPSGAELEGELEAEAHAMADAGGFITGIFHTHYKAGLMPPLIPGKDEAPPTVFHEGRVTLSLNEQALIAQIDSDLAEGGAIQGELEIVRSGLPKPLGGGQTDAEAVTGHLTGDVKDLSLLPALIPGVEHTQGRLVTTLTATGSWNTPQIKGEMRLEDGSAVIPALGITPHDIKLVARGDERGHVHVDGKLRSKDGTLKLTGDMQYDHDQGLSIKAQLSGNRVEVANTAEYYVLASPKIRLNVQGRRIDFDGEIAIPEANLRPRDASGAVSASGDVVIIEAEGPTDRGPRWEIYSKLRLTLGDFVKFSGFGLNGMLRGDITLVDEPQKPTVARGELNIKDGEYRAYAQKLQVDRGRLLFFGGTVDNPGMDIRAVRVIEDVTAGIQVSGTLKAPQVQVFSEPAMAEADALSYLLLGRPLNKATTSEGQQLYGAALSLGLAGGGLLANQIGERFGIDDLRVESGGSFGEGALVIRHYLSPKLYISYGVGLMEQFNIFLMRYQISRRWALEAESGLHSGADMVYTLEKK